MEEGERERDLRAGEPSSLALDPLSTGKFSGAQPIPTWPECVLGASKTARRGGLGNPRRMVCSSPTKTRRGVMKRC